MRYSGQPVLGAISVREKHFWKNTHTLLSIYALTCKWQGSTSRCHTPTAQIERKVEPLWHWHGLL